MVISKLPETTNAATRQEWRDLGFFYDYNEENKEWHFIGSKIGLEKFRDILLDYSSNPTNNQKSEHNHYGPYMYLKFMTWDTAGINENCIQGSVADFKRLADLVGRNLNKALPDPCFVISEEYTKDASVSLVFSVKEESFDPASADPQLK